MVPRWAKRPTCTGSRGVVAWLWYIKLFIWLFNIFLKFSFWNNNKNKLVNLTSNKNWYWHKLFTEPKLPPPPRLRLFRWDLPPTLGSKPCMSTPKKGGVSLASCMTCLLLVGDSTSSGSLISVGSANYGHMVGEAAPPSCAFAPALIEMNERPGKCFN